MNEQERADALAQHLDALFAGESLSEEPEAELAELLEVAQAITAVAPAPRPEFGPALQESLWQSIASDGLTTGAADDALAGDGTGAGFPVALIAILVGLGMLGGLLGAVIWGVARLNQDDQARPTPQPVQTEAVATPPLPTMTVAPATPVQSVDGLPTPTPTPIMDVLPPVTITVESTVEFQPPPGLVPGQPDSSSDDNDNGQGNSSGGGGGGGDDDDDDE